MKLDPEAEIASLRERIAALEEGGCDRPVVCALVAAFDDRDRVLLGLKTTGSLDGLWVIPGGKVERGETLADAARREFAEECGIAIEKGLLVPAGAFEHVAAASHKICHLFVARIYDEPGRSGSDLSRLEWMPLREALERAEHPLTREMIVAARSALRSPDIDVG